MRLDLRQERQSSPLAEPQPLSLICQRLEPHHGHPDRQSAHFSMPSSCWHPPNYRNFAASRGKSAKSAITMLAPIAVAGICV